MRKISTAAVTCVLASTAVLGATQAHASPWDCNVTGSLDQSGGPTNPIPWLNGTDGKLPELQGRTSAVEYITGALSPTKPSSGSTFSARIWASCGTTAQVRS